MSCRVPTVVGEWPPAIDWTPKFFIEDPDATFVELTNGGTYDISALFSLPVSFFEVENTAENPDPSPGILAIYDLTVSCPSYDFTGFITRIGPEPVGGDRPSFKIEPLTEDDVPAGTYEITLSIKWQAGGLSGVFTQTLTLVVEAAAPSFVMQGVGTNYAGQLGNTDDLADQPSLVDAMPPAGETVVDFFTGGGHSVLLMASGKMYLSGYGQNGELGIGDALDKVGWTLLPGPQDWVKIGGGNANTFGIRSDGTLWAWGGNSSGQLGVGDTFSRNDPTQVGVATDWVKISKGFGEHTLAMRADGIVLACGWNAKGQVGDNTVFSRDSFVTTGLNAGVDAELYTGAESSYVLLADGSMKCWGENSEGECGVGDTTDKHVPTSGPTGVAKFYPGAYCGIFIKNDGSLWAFGSGLEGPLGQGDTANHSSPVQIGSDVDWLEVSAGQYTTLAIKSPGTLWGCGANWYGMLGQGDFVDSHVMIQIGTATNWSKVTGGYGWLLVRTS